MIRLTEQQRELMLKLGNTESVLEAAPIEVLEELIKLGLVYERASDGHLDFTELGESVYDQIGSSDAN